MKTETHSSRRPTIRNRFVVAVNGVDVLCVWVKNHNAACALAAELLGVSESVCGAHRIDWKA